MSTGEPRDYLLTPVKVRGKKKNRGDVGRATKVRRELDSTAVNISSKGGFTKPNCQVEGASRGRIKPTRISLQSLPTEILEQIFFDCLEINLLHVFPRLAQAVSNERIYSCIAMLAIWKEPIPKKDMGDEETDDELAVDEPMDDEPMDELTRTRLELGEKKIMKAFRPVGYRKLSREEAMRLQSQILNCRWATLERISSCLVKCADLTQLRVRGYDGETKGSDLAQVLKVLEGNLIWSYPGSLNLSNSSPTSASLQYCAWVRSYTYKTFRNPVRIFFIPDKVIDKRPWTSQKLDFFRLLRLSLYQGKRPIPMQPFSREILHEGVHQAIVECRSEILEALLELDEYCVRSIVFSFKGIPMNSGYDIPPEHFLTAIRHSTNPDMLQTLVRASAESLPFDNPEITKWALEREKFSCPFSKWLLDLMVQLPSYQRHHSSEQSIFVCGMYNLSWLRYKGSKKHHYSLSNDPIYEEYKKAWLSEPHAWAVGLFCLN